MSGHIEGWMMPRRGQEGHLRGWGRRVSGEPKMGGGVKDAPSFFFVLGGVYFTNIGKSRGGKGKQGRETHPKNSVADVAQE